MAIRNIIFDLDGTLIDSSDGVVEAVNYSLRQVGEPEQPADVIKTYIGYPLSQMYPDFTTVPVKELHRHFQVKAAETVVASTGTLPGVEDALKVLQAAGYRLAIASTKIKRHIDGIVAKFGWEELLTAYTGGDEVSRVKPDPEIMNVTLSRMRARAEETVVVGDTVNDVLAAKAVPMTVIAIDSPYGGKERLLASQPDFYLESLDDLMDLLARINTGS